MLKNYLKIAFKVLLRRKFFTFISLFGVSLTLFVLMVSAALLDHTFGSFPPETRQDRTLNVLSLRMSGPNTIHGSNPGYMFLDRYVRTLPDVEKVSIHSEPAGVSAFKNGERIPLFVVRTDGEFWEILDFKFLEGAPFTAEDEKNANFVAVINESTRKKFFGEEHAVGKAIEADGQRFRIVGVVPNVPILRQIPFSDVWVPISTAKSNTYKQQLMGGFVGTILAKRRADLPAIQREFQSRLSRVELPNPKIYDKLESAAQTLFEHAESQFFDNKVAQGGIALLGVILVLAVLFMVLPAINLVNINVSRILERSSEIGVRKAFGASRRTLIGQFVVENLALSLVGGLLGFILSFLVLAGLTSSGLIPYAEFHMNYRIFFYGLGLASFFGLFSGVIPAWKMSRLHPVAALRGRSR